MRILTLVLVAGALACTPPAYFPERQCIALGFGRWAPYQPYFAPVGWAETLPPLFLSRDTIQYFYRTDRGWSAVHPAPSLRGDTLWPMLARAIDRTIDVGTSIIAQRWRATRDSLWVSAPAELSNGLDIAGTLRGDTMVGRAHAYSDGRIPYGEPRANAYGILYGCGDSTSQAPALARLRDLIDADVPDTLLGQAEAAREQAEFDRHFR